MTTHTSSRFSETPINKAFNYCKEGCSSSFAPLNQTASSDDCLKTWGRCPKTCGGCLKTCEGCTKTCEECLKLCDSCLKDGEEDTQAAQN